MTPLVRYIAEDGEDLFTVREAAPKAYLVLLVNGRASQSFPLRTEITMGRDKTNSVVIADQKVSRHHATLSPADDNFMLVDQGSANGTYLNGVLISQPTRLKDKDRIIIGDTSFLFSTNKPDFDAIIPLPSTPHAPQAALSSPSLINVEQNNRALWILVICLGLIIVLLLLMLTTVLGILIGRSQTLDFMLFMLSL